MSYKKLYDLSEQLPSTGKMELPAQKVSLEQALEQCNHFKEKTICESNVGKRIRLYPGPKVHEHWFRPFTDRYHMDGKITSVYWQHGNIPFYVVLFDDGFEGVFFAREKLLKYL